jgi:hypothetical protein
MPMQGHRGALFSGMLLVGGCSPTATLFGGADGISFFPVLATFDLPTILVISISIPTMAFSSPSMYSFGASAILHALPASLNTFQMSELLTVGGAIRQI